MRGRAGLLACAAFIAGALSVPGIVPLAASAEPGREILKTIIEKTRQREEAFDGFDWRLSMRKGDAAGAEGEFGRRWVKSQGRWLESWTHEGTSEQEAFSISAWDGRAYRRFSRNEGRAGRGDIWAADDRPPGLECETILGLRFAWPPARLSEVLEGDLGKLREKYRGYSDLKIGDLKVTVKESEGDGGRKIQVVDCVPGVPSKVARYYFAPELDYACIAAEWGEYENDKWTVAVKCELSDFHEVREGFFIPFTLKVTGVQEGSLELRTLSFEMPGSFDEGLFMVSFPPGTSVRDGILHMAYVVGAAPPVRIPDGISEDREEAGESDVPEGFASTGDNLIAKTGTAAAGSRPAPEVPWEVPGGGTRIGKWAVAAVIAAVVAIATVLWQRKGRA